MISLFIGLSSFCEKNNVGLATIKQIADALKQPLTYDFRESKFSKF